MNAIEVKEVPFSERLLLDAPAAADMLSVGVTTLKQLPIKQTRIPGSRIVRWAMEDLEQYVRSLRG